MSKTLSKTSKSVASKKGKTGSTKAKSCRTSPSVLTSPTWFLDLDISNSKGTSITSHDERWSVSFDATPESTCEFSLRETLLFGRDQSLRIQVGPKGLVFRLPSGEVFRKIGWKELTKLEKIENKKLMQLAEEGRLDE